MKTTEKRIKMMNNGFITANGIGVEGAKAMSEMLQVNTTLTSLNLGCEKEQYKKKTNKHDN